MSGYFFLLGAIYFLNVLCRMLFPLLAPVFSKTFASHELGALYFLLAAGFSLALLVAQMLSSRIGYGRVIAFSAMGMGFVLATFPMVEQFYPFAFFLFVMGCFAGLFTPSAIAYLRLIVHETRLGRSMGFFSSFQTAAMISTPAASEWLGGEFQIPFWGTLLFFLGVLFKAWAPRQEEGGEFPSFSFYKTALAEKETRSLFMLQCLAIGLNIGIYLMVPVYFIEQQSSVCSTMSISRILGIFLTLFSGFLVDWKGVRPVLTGALFTAGMTTLLLGAVGTEAALIAICLQGAAAAALNAVVYMNLSKSVSGSLLSFFAASSFLIGAGVVPQIVGILGQWDCAGWGFFFLGGGALFCAFRNFLEKEVETA